MQTPQHIVCSSGVDEKGYTYWLKQLTCYIDWQCSVCGFWDFIPFQFYEKEEENNKNHFIRKCSFCTTLHKVEL